MGRNMEGLVPEGRISHIVQGPPHYTKLDVRDLARHKTQPNIMQAFSSYMLESLTTSPTLFDERGNVGGGGVVGDSCSKLF